MHMLLAAVLVHALHSARKDAEKPFNRVRVDRGIFRVHVCPYPMPNHTMFCAMTADVHLLTSFVRHDPGLAIDVRLHDRHDCRSFKISDNHATGSPGFAVDAAQHLVLVGGAATLLRTARLDHLLVADESLVDLYSRASATERHKATLAHRFSKAVRHEPSRVVLHAKDAMDVMAADPLLAGRQEVRDLEPLVHG